MDDPFILGATNSEQRTRLELMNSTNNNTTPVLNDETQSITTTNCTRFLHVEGPHRLWLQKAPVFYYTLRISDQSDNTGILYKHICSSSSVYIHTYYWYTCCVVLLCSIL